jgi:coenzyme Q-binding protein COQ10
MPRHAETRRLPYAADKLFDLVADIEKYPEFLPWCVGARIRSRSETETVADLVIGFRAFRERFTSRVRLDRPGRIDVAFADGPFKYLQSHWIFRPEGEHLTAIDFAVDFEFRNKILGKVIGLLFDEAVHRMVAAFEARARALYGTDAPALRPLPAR